MPDTPPTRRRWFHVGIGMFFVLMTVFAMLLGWEQRDSRQRSRLREADGAMFINGPPNYRKPLRAIRSLFGVVRPDIIVLPEEKFSVHDMIAYKKAFPEAVVIRRRIDDGPQTPEH